jgi:hypothetical protein
MLERYFLRPATLDQIRASWIADAIERYVVSLTERGYAARNFHARIPILRRFGDFARDHGATSLVQLPAHVAPFVETCPSSRGQHLAVGDAPTPGGSPVVACPDATVRARAVYYLTHTSIIRWPRNS